ncbi:hypothetical protein STAS_06136 [Striga asiatica]|uniref:PB1-like domain-containing protein n=1 Tax=Striga asiatica TaxID=4170 RepID=A0A5A7PCG2_STRAF|nr:hypothetical protein STAS_06136 [Striga asiatica]
MDDNVEYLGGDFETVYGLDVDRFGYFDLEEQIQKLGCTTWTNIYYRIPRVNGKQALRVLVDDVGVMELIAHSSNHKSMIEIYVDGGNEFQCTEVHNVVGEKTCEGRGASKVLDELGEENIEGKGAEAEVHDDLGEENIEGRGRGAASEVHDEFFEQNIEGRGAASEVHDEVDELEHYIDNYMPDEEGATGEEGADEESEDEDYMPQGESSSEDDLSDEAIASEDDEYIEARKNIKKYRKSPPHDGISESRLNQFTSSGLQADPVPKQPKNKRGRPRKVPAGPVIEPVGGVSSSTICEPDGGGSSRISRKTSTRSKKKQSSRTVIHKERAMGVGILQSEETGNIYMRTNDEKHLE